MPKTATILQPNGDRQSAIVVSKGTVWLVGLLIAAAGVLWAGAQAVFGAQATQDSRISALTVEVQNLKEQIGKVESRQQKDTERLLAAIEGLRKPGG